MGMDNFCNLLVQSSHSRLFFLIPRLIEGLHLHYYHIGPVFGGQAIKANQYLMVEM